MNWVRELYYIYAFSLSFSIFRCLRFGHLISASACSCFCSVSYYSMRTRALAKLRPKYIVIGRCFTVFYSLCSGKGVHSLLQPTEKSEESTHSTSKTDLVNIYEASRTNPIYAQIVHYRFLYRVFKYNTFRFIFAWAHLEVD